jgi:hypothetical protein
MSGLFNVREHALTIGAEFFHLEDFVAIFVPTTKNIQETITPENLAKYRNLVIDKLNDICGGTTLIMGTGSFRSSELRKLVKEEILIASAFVNIDDESIIIELFRFSQKLCQEMSQESIGLIIGDCLFFVKN